jgi:hypothetical protein
MATCMALPLQCGLHPVGESGHPHHADGHAWPYLNSLVHALCASGHLHGPSSTVYSMPWALLSVFSASKSSHWILGTVNGK